MSRDRLLRNKWTALDRLENLRAMADRHSEQHYSDYDRDMFARISNAISLETDALTAHVKQENVKEAWKPGDDGIGVADMTALHITAGERTMSQVSTAETMIENAVTREQLLLMLTIVSLDTRLQKRIPNSRIKGKSREQIAEIVRKEALDLVNEGFPK